MNDRFGAVIPAFNAGQSLQVVLEGVKKYIRPADIVVVDDGSADDTASVARRCGVTLISHTENRGKGEALKTGWSRLVMLGHIEAVFTIDADGQHDPDEIPSFIRAFDGGEKGIIIGNRMGGMEGMPFHRRMTNMFTSAVVSARAGTRIDDSQSGYRLIESGLLREIELETSRFETESEILMKAARRGARISSVPIRTIYADERSKINPVRDTIRFFVLVFRSLFW
jgi:glycosyltransferase involved in cell wall biosynthesis